MKKKGMFSGWKQVYCFTLKDAVSAKSFKFTTIGIAVVLFAIIIIIYGGMAYTQSQSMEEPIALKTIYVCNNSGMDFYHLSEFPSQAGRGFQGVQFLTDGNEKDKLQSKVFESPEDDAVLWLQSGEDKALLLTLLIPDSTECSGDECEELLGEISHYLYKEKLQNSGVENTKLAMILSPVTTQYVKQGAEPESMGSILVKMIVPLISILVLYFMILLHGQSVGKSVASEKTSKLMETLLLSVQPYALVFGKILGMATVGLIQMISWAVGLILGFAGGNILAGQINKGFESPLTDLLYIIRESGMEQAFQLKFVVLAIMTLLLGYLFYLVLAGLVGSRISKSEDLAQGMGLFQIIVVAGFMGSYFTSLGMQSDLLAVERYLPVTSPFLLPSDLLLGKVSFGEGFIMFLVLAVFTLILVCVTGRMYRNSIFYKGRRSNS